MIKNYRSLISVSSLYAGLLLLSLILQTSPLRSSAGLGRLVFTDFSKGDRKFTVDVFDLDTNRRSSVPIERYQDIGIKSVVDERHIYIRLCLATDYPSACSAYVSEVVPPENLPRFENMKQIWRENYSSPIWSPDGSHIAFSLKVNSTYKENPAAFSRDIYVMAADGSYMFDLNPNDNALGVTWSPNSQQVAFGCYDNQKLCIANIDGTHLLKLNVPDGIRVNSPSWSPDGHQIVFSLAAKDSRSASLYLVNLDGSNMHQLTDAEAAFHKEATWSPDSSKIAFVSDTMTDQEIYVVNRDGTGLLDLSDGLNGSEFDSVWSPDSSKVAFFSYQKEAGDFLYIVDVNGGNSQKITDNSTYATFGTIAPEVFWIP